MKYQVGCFSLTGDRSMNQDRCAPLQDPEAVLLVLGDGMGGHPGGDKAAEILVSSCQRLFERTEKPAPAPDQLLRHLFRQSHESVVAYGSAQSPAIEPRTTAVVALIQGDMAYWAHTGDSRLYLLRAGRVVARTQDHSYVEELHQRGEISAEERDSHPYRHYVTRALGGQEEIAQPTLGKPTGLEPGDVILLCSDGLWAQSPEADMVRALADGSRHVETIIRDLAHAAMMQGHPFSDNVTALALRWLGVDDPRQYRPGIKPEPTSANRNIDQAMDELKQALQEFESDNDQENQ